MKPIKINHLEIGSKCVFTIICGPCVIEGETFAMQAAEFLKTLCDKLGIQLIYKSSYDKANRLSVDSYRGPGIEEGLRILEKVKTQFELPILTDIHSVEEVMMAAQVCDILQIPAFLCRQTDIAIAAGKSQKVVNVKKGQFLAPQNMQAIAKKIASTGNEKIILTDRGVSFGYNNLVSDFRAIPIMQESGYPVCFDATHSVQLPGGQGGSSGGQKQFVEPLAKAAIAIGANLLFLEAHPDPKHAKSDAQTMLSFKELETTLPRLKQLYDFVCSKM